MLWIGLLRVVSFVAGEGVAEGGIGKTLIRVGNFRSVCIAPSGLDG